jgi:hypothetical protein
MVCIEKAVARKPEGKGQLDGNTNSNLQSLACPFSVLFCNLINYLQLKDFCVLFF